ncbi:SPOR domain-containing protein [Paenibacillus sp. GCM10012307]|uniref:SPOR domain-containing protein n=1 Tax=Paenibacillus roseus TaxID=2798579 RepID=A0A934MQ94_9BACL|nr:SPOR domain-containing protein [Paenibacillus roseus]MBJ6362921.1 SPOR domain-containing protein [Paenibacillus roseus]
MNSKARITFRFDNQGNAQQGRNETPGSEFSLVGNEENLVKDGHSAVSRYHEEFPFTEKSNSSESPFQDNPEALGALIREADGRAPAPIDLGEQITSESSYLSRIPGRIDKRISDRRRKIIIDVKDEHSPSIRHTDKGPSWFKVAVSVTGAIATGALFGYLILSLFAGQNAWQNNEAKILAVSDPPTPVAPPSVNRPASVIGGPENAENETPKTAVQLNRPETNYYILQYGVFSSQEGMQTALSQLDQRGVAAASSSVDKYRVYAGIASGKAEAAKLAELLDGLNVYISRLTVPALTEVAFQGDSALLENFLLETDQLISTFSSVTNEQLQKEQPQRFDGSPWKTIHQKWTGLAAKLKQQLPENGKKSFEQMVQSLQTIAAALGEFDKNPARSYMWTAQSELMEAVLAQKDWIGSIRTL